MNLFKIGFSLVTLILIVSCTNNVKVDKEGVFIDLTLKYDKSLKSYKVSDNGEVVYLENPPGRPGVVYEGFVSEDHISKVKDFLNHQAPFKIDTTISSWQKDESCADEPLYRLIYLNKFNKEIVFMGSSCIRQTAVDSFVFRFVKHLDSVANNPYFKSFDKVIPPPPPF